jgi:hypothetical protein
MARTLAFVGMFAAACGGALDQDASGGGGRAAVGAAPIAQGGSGGAAGNSTGGELPPGADLVAISPAELYRLSACNGSTMECEPTLKSVELVIDLSSSMTRVAPRSNRTSWEIVRDGLRVASIKQAS